jgi:hypothetical protein
MTKRKIVGNLIALPCLREALRREIIVNMIFMVRE